MFRRVISAGLVATIALGPVAAAAECLTRNERSALQLRALQTELMVATLSCRSVTREDVIGHYNAFARKNAKSLSSSSQALVRYFDRRYGAQGRKEHDSFMTALANDYSRQSMNAANFCDASAVLLRDVARADDRALNALATRRTPVNVLGAGDCAIAAVDPKKEKR